MTTFQGNVNNTLEPNCVCTCVCVCVCVCVYLNTGYSLRILIAWVNYHVFKWLIL